METRDISFEAAGEIVGKFGRGFCQGWLVKDVATIIRKYLGNKLAERNDQINDLRLEIAALKKVNILIETKRVEVRDYFACLAMNGLLSSLNREERCDILAVDAYHMADAMLKARGVNDE